MSAKENLRKVGDKIKLFFNRIQTKFLQKFKKAQVTVDAEFQSAEDRFHRTSKSIDQIQYEMKEWQRCTSSYVDVTRTLAKDFAFFYEGGGDYEQQANDFRECCMRVSDAYYDYADKRMFRKCVQPLERVRERYEKLMDDIESRNNRLLEYDYYRFKLEKMKSPTAKRQPTDKQMVEIQTKITEHWDAYQVENRAVIDQCEQVYSSQFDVMDKQFVSALTTIVSFFQHARECVRPCEQHMTEVPDYSAEGLSMMASRFITQAAGDVAGKVAGSGIVGSIAGAAVTRAANNVTSGIVGDTHHGDHVYPYNSNAAAAAADDYANNPFYENTGDASDFRYDGQQQQQEYDQQAYDQQAYDQQAYDQQAYDQQAYDQQQPPA